MEVNEILNKVTHGDCMNILKKLPDNSIDSIVTDPPYGLKFMNKEFDKAVPSVEIWKECLRVLKPGAFAWVMSSPRQDVLAQMIINLRDAGFNTSFSSLYWTFSQGFPKVGSISKPIMRRRKDTGVVVGKSNRHNSRAFGAGAGDVQYGTYKGGVPDIVVPTDPDAKQYHGAYAGFSPKPALEVILCGMKPIEEDTYVAQVLKNGHGITWMDNCRIPCRDEAEADGGHETGSIEFTRSDLHGRFPSNLLISDDILNDGKERKSGKDAIRRQEGFFVEHGGLGKAGDVQVTYGDAGDYSRYFSLDRWWEKQIQKLPADVQKVLPFLIVSKPDGHEKHGHSGKLLYKSNSYNKKCLKCGKWRTGKEVNDKCVCEQPEWKSLKGNTHVTIKPIKLMSYLIALGSRPKDIVLDPFLGSGTTAIACKILGRNFIGIEKEAEYCTIAENRLSEILL